MTNADPALAPEADQPQTIALSLIAHTNVGKTTLARTLLGRDVGDVRDEPHVTVRAKGKPPPSEGPSKGRRSRFGRAPETPL